MNKNELFNKTDTVVSETQVALQTLFDELNKGQQKKVLKNESVTDSGSLGSNEWNNFLKFI